MHNALGCMVLLDVISNYLYRMHCRFIRNAFYSQAQQAIGPVYLVSYLIAPAPSVNIVITTALKTTVLRRLVFRLCLLGLCPGGLLRLLCRRHFFLVHLVFLQEREDNDEENIAGILVPEDIPMDQPRQQWVLSRFSRDTTSSRESCTRSTYLR